jgi:DNA invertase Pin-like site-specific DNA recombinase
LIAYVRVSTRSQGDSGAGLAAQRATIEAAHDVSEWFEDVESGSGKHLPGRAAAIEACIRTKQPLVAAKLDRLTRSTIDFYELNELARKHDFALVLLDVGLDTRTAMGEAMAGIAAVFAQLERRRISDRTKEALAARAAAGVRLGAEPSIPSWARERATELFNLGASPARVSALFALDGVPMGRTSIYAQARKH